MPRRGPDALDRTIGRNIRFFRILRGFTQVRLAQAIGTTYQQVQKYEQGRTAIVVSRLADIAQALGVPLATFWTSQGPAS